MSDISAWYKEVVKDKVTIKFQAHGGLLDGTMTGGDTIANVVKFPIANSVLGVYKLTGAIEMVPTGTADLTTVQVTMEDFEASAWWRTQDAYKAGPSEQDALAQLVVKAQRRKRDTMKIDALTTFAGLGDVTTIGTGVERPDILHFEQARAEIAATGAEDEGEIKIFCLIPAMWMTQLAFYKEFAEGKWVGDENMPFSKTQRMRTRTVRGVHYIEGPDSYFTEYSTGKLEAFMWHKDSMGAEMPINQEAVTLSQHQDRQGSPWLMKNAISGAAIGIQAAGVKRLRLLKITAPARPA
jgi:hypothetical protein